MMSLIMPRRSAALLVLCATLLTCTPASATWTGSYYQVAQDEKKAGGTCDTSSNPPTCAKVKELTRSTAQSVPRVTRLEMTATTSCALLPDPVNLLHYAECNCDTLVCTWWFFPANGATCPTTTPTEPYNRNATYLTKESFLDAYTGGCASNRQQNRDPSMTDACTPAVWESVSRVLPGYNTTSGDLVTEVKKLCPAWYATPPTAAPATTPAPAATDTQHFVTMTVTMPYSKVSQGRQLHERRVRVYTTPASCWSMNESVCVASQAEFDTAKQDKYKVAVANAAGTTAANVEILSITDGRRRAGSVKVETKVTVLVSMCTVSDYANVCALKVCSCSCSCSCSRRSARVIPRA